MTRALILLVKITLICALAYWLVANPGHVSVDWQGWRIETSIGVVAVVLLLVAGLLAFAWWLWRGVRAAPGRFLQSRGLARRERGYRALTQGLVAVAAGDRLEASRQARKAKALLNDPPLTMLLSAQAAQLSGDDQAATRYFEAMLDQPDAAFLGVRGLMMQAAKAGRKEEALQLAQRAYKLRPDTPWVLEELLDLQSEQEQWDAALKIVDEAVRAKALTVEQGRQRKAELLMEKVREAQRVGQTDDALKWSLQAHKLDPDLVPAVTAAARLSAAQGRQRRAVKLIETAWTRQPAPALANAYRDIAGKVAPLDQVKRFQKLLSLRPTDPESHYALARASLDAELWGEARGQLGELQVMMEGDPPARFCRMMAELEESEHGNTPAARDWLAKAAAEDGGGAEAEVA